MQRYIIHRLIHGVIVLMGVTFVTFFLVRLTGDPAAAILGPDATPQGIQKLYHQMGLDDPMFVQYVRYLDSLAHGDFGNSFLYGQPAFSLVLERLPAMFELTVAALAVNLALSFSLGILPAVKRHSVIDRVSAIFVFGSQTMPVFWSGILAILVFAVGLGWLPASGRRISA